MQSKSGQAYVLRIHRPEYHTLEELQSEQIWTEALLSASLDVPVAIRTKSGERYSQIRVASQVRNVGLLEWVEGRSLRELFIDHSTQVASVTKHDQIKRAYSNIGTLLAKLHQHATNWQPPETFTRQSTDAEGLMGEDPFWGRFWEAQPLDQKQRAVLRNMKDEILTLLHELPTNKEDYSLIHADLHTNNVIFHDNDLHIIDFDDAGFGWHAYDFAVALADYRDPREAKVAEEALFQSYVQIRPSPKYVRSLIPLFTLIRTLASIGWMDMRQDLGNLTPRIHECYNHASETFKETLISAEKIIAALPR